MTLRTSEPGIRLLLSLSALGCVACGASEQEGIGTVQEAVAPTINSFTVASTTPDWNTLQFSWQLTLNGGTADKVAYVWEDLGGGGPILYWDSSVQDYLSADHDVGYWGWCCGMTGPRAMRGGWHRYTLSAHTAEEPYVVNNLWKEKRLDYLPQPTILADSLEGPNGGAGETATDVYRNRVDIYSYQNLTKPHRKLRYQVPFASPTGVTNRFVRIVVPLPDGKQSWETKTVTSTSEVFEKDIDPAQLTDNLNAFSLYYCENSDPTHYRETCSRKVDVTYEKRAGFFDGDARQILTSSAQSARLTWTGDGQSFKVTARNFTALSGICPNAANPNCTPITTDQVCITNTNKSFTIPYNNVTSGAHEVFLQACDANCQACADTCDDNHKGCYYKDRREIVRPSTDASEPVANWTFTNWSSAFRMVSRHALYERPMTGDALDVTFDSGGNVWALGEFAQAVAYIGRANNPTRIWPLNDPNDPAYAQDTLTHFQMPLRRQIETLLHDKSTAYNLPTTPFCGDPHSDAGERIIDTGATTGDAKYDKIVWFTQGGKGLRSAPTDRNYSRIIGFKRNGADDPSTQWDDRICAIHVPGPTSGDGLYGNGLQVYGVAWDKILKRVWLTKYSVKDGTTDSTQLSWFDPANFMTATGAWDQTKCNAMLNYSDDGAIASANTTNNAFFNNVIVANSTVHPRLFHIDIVPQAAQNSSRIWFAAAPDLDRWTRGTLVGYYDSAANAFGPNGSPLEGPATHLQPTIVNGVWSPPFCPSPTSNCGLFGPFPWQLRNDGSSYLYYGEYGDRDIVRFVKSSSTFQQVHVPFFGRNSHLHSLALDANKRLWFTLANEASGAAPEQTATRFGYISWPATGTPTGVIYAIPGDLAWPLPSPNDRQHSFRGIAVRPLPSNSTKVEIALADNGTDEVVILAEN